MLSLQQQQQQRIVILEIGTAIVRAGYAGEAAPRVRLTSPLSEYYKGDGSFLLQESRLALWFSELLTLALLVPKLSQQAVVLVESPTLPRVLREMIASALAANGPPTTLTSICGPAACAAVTTEACILVVDIGARETRTLAVVDGYVLTSSLAVADLGVDVGVDAFFCKDDCLPVLDGQAGGGIACVILRCLTLCPLEVRPRLAPKIALCGGGALLNGLRPRLLADLNRLQQSNYFRQLTPLNFAFHSFSFSPPDIPWIGTSLLVATALAEHRFDGGLHPAQLNQFGLLPDFFASPNTFPLHDNQSVSTQAESLVPGIRTRASFGANMKGGEHKKRTFGFYKK